ncbi:cupin domain-containing protein [Gordonia humi]|uniref:cupin domain-containing protein n=1 Tax=Gordonia humi TaxID=686429 RepID=UPI0036136E8B
MPPATTATTSGSSRRRASRSRTCCCPPGGEGPEHTHHDVEEAFFVLEGEIEVGVHRDGKVEKRTMGYRDMIVVPAGVPRSLKNNTDENALFAVIIGTQKPQVPSYPETSVMHGITREKIA